MEVVVVELVRAEGRREADSRPGGLVVDEAAGIPLRAAIRLGPLLERLDRLVPQVRDDVLRAQLLAEHDE